MSDVSIGEMDSDLKEYLAYFKNNDSEKEPKRKKISAKMHQKYEKLSVNLSSQSSPNSSRDEYLSEGSSLLAGSLDKFNLQDVNDLQASYTISENDATLLTVKEDSNNDDKASAIGKLILSLGTSEDTINSDMDDENTISSFNIKANIFTVDDLATEDGDDSITKSVSDENVSTGHKITHVYRSEPTTYKDDFEEEEDSHNAIQEESFVNETVEDVVSVNTQTVNQPSMTTSDELTIANISSCDVDKHRNVSQTEETQTFYQSSTSQDTDTSVENSLSMHEVCHITIG